MSHFTKLDKAKIVDPAAFIKACGDLGFDDASHDVEIKDYYGKKMNVDVACKATNSDYSIALKKNDENNNQYDMIADWWGIRRKLPKQCEDQGINNDSDLQDTILRHTTKNTIVRKYKRQGFRADVREDENNNIKIRLQRA